MEKTGNSGTRKDIVDINANTLHPSITSMCINGQWNATIENYKCTRKYHYALTLTLKNIDKIILKVFIPQ